MNPNKRVCIFAQTGCDIAWEEAEREGIVLIPDLVVHKDKEYKSYIDMDARELYHVLRTTDKLPMSAHAGPHEWIKAFREAEARGYEEMIGITMTSKMAGVFSTVTLASKLAQEEGFLRPIYPYDSFSCSHGAGLIVREANRLAEEGLCAQQILPRLDALRENIGLYFMFESLRYVSSGGRLAMIGALMTDKLGIRPLLTFRDGLARSLGVQRNAREGMKAVVRRYEREADRTKEAIIFHGDDPHRAQRVYDMIREFAPDAPLRMEIVGAPIALHSGPSTIGIAFVKPYPA